MFMYALIRMPSVRLSLFRSSNLMGVNENNGQNVKGMHCESKTTTKGQRKPRPNVSTSLPFYFLLPKHKTTKKSGNGLWSKLSDSTNIAVITIPFNIRDSMRDNNHDGHSSPHVLLSSCGNFIVSTTNSKTRTTTAILSIILGCCITTFNSFASLVVVQFHSKGNPRRDWRGKM